VYILATAVLAALADLVWRILHGGWDMPPWLQAVIIVGCVGGIDVAERAVYRIRVRRERARRRAHARSASPKTGEPA
jgi:hypothetical protein